MMKTFLSSPIKDSANNIVLKPRTLKTKRDYENFIKWLDASNSDLKKIKLPDKKKIEKLELKFNADGFSSESGGGINPLLPLLGGGLGGLAYAGGKKMIGKMLPKAASKAAPISDDAAKVAALKGGGKIAEKSGNLAAKLIPGLATAVNLGIAGYRFSQGDIVGGSLSALSAVPVLGWAAVGIDLAREFGAFEGTPFGQKKDKPKSKIETRLKEQEKTQREKAGRSEVTFASVTNKFDKIVSKFEKITSGISGTGPGTENNGKKEEQTNPYEEPGQYPTLTPTGETYDGPVSGDTFFPLPGGEAGTSAGQQFGASRDRGTRSHAGLDMVKWSGDLAAPVAAYKTGKVVESVSNGYNGYVTIDHGGGTKTRYYHTSPMVNTGDTVYGGQQIANLYPSGQNTHLHFEVYRSGTAVNPISAGLGQKIPAPLSTQKAKEQHDKSIGSTAKPGVNTMQRQQSPEEFFKGSQWENIFKDAKKKAQFFGEKYEFKGSMIKTPVTDSNVKQAQQMYNSYIRDLRDRMAKAEPVIPTAPSETLLRPGVVPAGNTIIFMNQPQAQSQATPQIVPIPISTGSGGGGVVVVSPSEGQILNSLWKTMLLTNLSAA
jgi:murein DD-endopeptidase MepM/ murein hydrolase activator NlpD